MNCSICGPNFIGFCNHGGGESFFAQAKKPKERRAKQILAPYGQKPASRCDQVAMNDKNSERMTEWRKQHYNDKPNPELCRHAARFMVDGKKLCARHAGIVALKILLEES